MVKNIFLLFIFLNLSFSGVSQSTYIKMLKEDTTTWQHFGVYLGVRSAFSATIAPNITNNSVSAIDTITINNLLYKRLFHLSTPATLDYSNKSFMGFIREDTVAKKVYFKLPSSSEILLYDFSLNVNDSSYLSFPYAPSLNGYYRVDSIVTKVEMSVPKKHFYIRKHLNNWNPQFDYFDIIEGIGSSYHILYLYTYVPSFGVFSSSSSTCKHPWNIGLACKHDDHQKKYQSCTHATFIWPWIYGNTFGDPCNYWAVIGGFKTNDWDRIVQIGPNPSDEGFNLSISQSFENINISITDLTGKILMELPKNNILQDGNSVHVSTKNLAQGVYIIQVNLNGTLIKRPIVVQH